MIAFLLVIFIVIYLNANVGIYGGGSDADDALKIGAKIVLNLDNPYRPKTYLGLPITPGLGALFLSIPLYLMENVSHQNSFWLFLLIFLIHIYYRDPSAVFSCFRVGLRTTIAPQPYLAQIVWPPSTTTLAPVMKDASSEAKNSAT